MRNVGLTNALNLKFEVDHVSAVKNGGKETANNMQILIKAHNAGKGTSKWRRFKSHEQIDYIKAVVKVQSILAKTNNIKLEKDFIDRIIKDLENIFDGNID